MITYEFPNQSKTFFQNNRTDLFPLGNLWSTFNVDLQSKVGAIRLSPRLRIVASTGDSANLGIPVAFRFFDTKIWAICDTRVFSNAGEPDDIFTEDNSTGAQTTYTADESDLEIFNGTLCSTTTSALYSKAASGTGTGAWTSRDSLNTGTEHVMCYFWKFDRLYYSNQTDNIISIDTAWATADPGAGIDYAISLSSSSTDYTITCMKSNSDSIWIGTVNLFSSGAVGKVCQWDGKSPQTSAEYSVNNAQGIMAIAIHPERDNPYVMDSNGILSEFNGVGFSEVARLPFPQGILPYNIGDTDNERFIHPNGMYFTRNGTLRVLINNRANTGNIVENMPSGIWELSPDKNFVHIGSGSINYIDSALNQDFGQNRVSRVGALASMQIPSTNNPNGTMLAGMTIYTTASATTSAVLTDNSLDTLQKKGYTVSDWIESENVDENWARVWPTFRKLLNANDAITFKYRLYEDTPTYFDLTWVTATTFTTATDLSAYWTSASPGGIGGEIEVLRGLGSGICAHITNITGTTVTIDTSFTDITTSTASARAQNWIKVLPVITPTRASNTVGYTYGDLPMDGSNSRIQIKTCMTFTGQDEFYRYKITSNPNTKIN